MKTYLFGYEEDLYSRWKIRTCADFQSMCISISLRDRARLRGRPHGNAWKVAVFQNPWLGKINPYWIKIFRCRGDEISYQEASDLFRSQLPIPLDRRPSQNWRAIEESGSSKVRKPRRAKPPRGQVVRPKPSSDFVTRGMCDLNTPGPFPYTNPYSSGRVLNDHVISRRVTSKSSVSTPNFKKLKKRDLPWNNFSMTYFYGRELEGSSYRFVPGQGTYASYGYIRGNGDTGVTLDQLNSQTNVPVISSTANAALMKALSRAKASNVNLAQAFAERRQTVSLLTSSINRLANLAIAIKNGNVKRAIELSMKGTKAKGTGKYETLWNSTGTHVIGRRYVVVVKPGKAPKPYPETAANLWLEFQYGWKPLLSDIYGSAELLANTFHMPKAVRVTAKSEAEVKRIDRIINSNTNETRNITVRTHSKVVLEFLEPTEWTATLVKTGLSNPALLAWELLPYSFVVDWVLPIGNYLQSIDAAVGLNFKRGSTTTTTFDEIVSSIGPSGGYTNGGSDVLITRKSKNRVVYNTIPMPAFPSFEPKLGVERALSALSLLTQAFTRGKTTVRV